MARAPVFNQTYQYYLEKIGALDLAACRDRLGFVLEQGAALIPLFNCTYRITSEGIHDPQNRPAGFEACVILGKYLLHERPGVPHAGEFCTFKDFKDAAPLITYFGANVEGAIARQYVGRSADLERACRQAGGVTHNADWAYQVKLRFMGLPKVPVYLLFNDSEETFPAQCTLLFERRAEHYLDMETLAILGAWLVKLL
jgi:hypothetical protein